MNLAQCCFCSMRLCSTYTVVKPNAERITMPTLLATETPRYMRCPRSASCRNSDSYRPWVVVPFMASALLCEYRIVQMCCWCVQGSQLHESCADIRSRNRAVFYIDKSTSIFLELATSYLTYDFSLRFTGKQLDITRLKLILQTSAVRVTFRAVRTLSVIN